jgi:drug/metabolite transporter (DMT)-like permease
MMPSRYRGIAATILAAVLWSTAGLFIKLLPQDAFTILFYRSAYAMLLFCLLFGKQVLQFNRQMWINTIFYTLLLVTFVVATKLTTAANAIFLQYTGTAYILLLEPLLFKTQLNRINLWTTIFCFLGMGLFFFGDLNWTGGLGIALAALSGLLLAALFLGQRLNPPQYHVAAIFWGNIWVMLIGLPFFLQSAPATLSQHGMLAFLGILQLGMGYVLFTYGLQRITALEASLLAMLEPILNPVWVLIGHGERPSNLAILGGLIIIAALIVRLILLDRQKRQSRAKQLSPS